MSEHRARKILERHKELKREKAPWLPLYELIGQYVFTRKQHFTSVGSPGSVQNAHIYDNTATISAPLMAAALVGAQWPNGAKSFRIRMPFDLADQIGRATGWEQKDTDELVRFYQWQTKRMASFMDNPEAGYTTALEEYMLDAVTFGIAGIYGEETDDDTVPIKYRAIDAKISYVDEGPDGLVDTVHIEREYSLRQMVAVYGLDSLSKKHQEEFLKGDCKSKVKVIQCISPRMDRDPYGYGDKNMPIASIHIAEDTEKILKESGYWEMPVPVSRFWKALGEKQGRSPAMNALPSILEANVIGESWSVFIEKTAKPPLLVLDDGGLGNGIIDDSPNGVTVIGVSGRLSGSQKVIDKLYDQGDLEWTASRRTELAEEIKNAFLIDRLMDLNNEKRMTAYETSIRDGLRGQSLNPVYTRQQAERFIPDIKRTYNVLWRKGLIGVIKGSVQEQRQLKRGIEPVYVPDILADRYRNNQDIYEIEFISPAVRTMQAEELRGIEHTLQLMTGVAPAIPEVIDIPDVEFTFKRIQELTGAPSEMIKSMEVIKKVRQARAEQQQAMMEAEQARSISETARNAGQANASFAAVEQQGAV